MTLPSMVLLDRDGTLNYTSSDEGSPLYYITHPRRLILKPGVREAVKLIKALEIPMVLITKQRCVVKGLATLDKVQAVNDHLQHLLDIQFEDIFIEPSAKDKSALYRAILDKYHLPPETLLLFDDSAQERRVAERFDIPAYNGTNLLQAVEECLL